MSSDFPKIVGRIEIIKSNLKDKESAFKALEFQINALKKDMTDEIKKYFDGVPQ